MFSPPLIVIYASVFAAVCGVAVGWLACLDYHDRQAAAIAAKYARRIVSRHRAPAHAVRTMRRTMATAAAELEWRRIMNDQRVRGDYRPDWRDPAATQPINALRAAADPAGLPGRGYWQVMTAGHETSDVIP